MAQRKKDRRFTASEQWAGETVYRCTVTLPSGRTCGHDTRDFAAAEAHDRGHDPPPQFTPPEVTPRDRFGNPIPQPGEPEPAASESPSHPSQPAANSSKE